MCTDRQRTPRLPVGSACFNPLQGLEGIRTGHLTSAFPGFNPLQGLEGIRTGDLTSAFSGIDPVHGSGGIRTRDDVLWSKLKVSEFQSLTGIRWYPDHSDA